MARVNREYTHILYTNARGFANTAAAYPIKTEDVAAAEQRAEDLNQMNGNSYSYVTTWERATSKAIRYAMVHIRNFGRWGYNYNEMLAENEGLF